MSITSTKSVQFKFPLVTLAVLFFFNIINPHMAYSQIDYFYKKNNSGFRLGIGGGITTLKTHYYGKPVKGAFVGSLDYDVNPYFSFGGEAQSGILEGVDNSHRFYYKTSTDNYLAANLNVRVALGQFYHYFSRNKLNDAIKRLYIGTGIGAIHTRIKFTYNDDLAYTVYGSPITSSNSIYFPLNVGTNIDLPGILGRDKLAINPNYQLNYVNSLYTDGFRTSPQSHLRGFYSLVSVRLKYKF
ncbi:hypothetical protein [Mucilaginibacter paludis]|uniref:Outer membrane protein beta-barrel domain-containing protein n=1 Tax=Mucilaginibacter paludis DSM 18603 TaxID=714943 RepID=H1Y4G5_9SPHI|nr:hypothetical protein [Mucilaginibacter paludis]EHQ26749.1 hypothetical protein Mucpa_2635 [Mucilaginibacter paludis DSM 18603]